jgi:hypothetical protein
MNQEALAFINRARTEAGLPPLERLPRGRHWKDTWDNTVTAACAIGIEDAYRPGAEPAFELTPDGMVVHFPGAPPDSDQAIAFVPSPPKQYLYELSGGRMFADECAPTDGLLQVVNDARALLGLRPTKGLRDVPWVGPTDNPLVAAVTDGLAATRPGTRAPRVEVTGRGLVIRSTGGPLVTFSWTPALAAQVSVFRAITSVAALRRPSRSRVGRGQVDPPSAGPSRQRRATGRIGNFGRTLQRALDGSAVTDRAAA